MKAILYIGHGTRSIQGAEEAVSFIKRVMARIDVPIQEISFLELTNPGIEEGFMRCVGRGATEISVIPLFLLAAGHIKTDIPHALSSLGERYPTIQVHVIDPFGVQEKILEGIAELVRITAGELTPKDGILIVGRGSSDPDIHVAFAEIAKGIQDLLCAEQVSVCYLAAAEPRFQEGLEVITEKTSGRVIVIPYLLFSGLLLTEVSQVIHKRKNLGQQIIHTGPLSEHRVIADIIIERVSKSN